MLVMVKRSVMALVAIVALPPYSSHKQAVAPSKPTAVSQDDMALAPPSDHAWQANALKLDPRAARTTGDVARDQKALPEERIVERSAPAPASLGKLPLMIGDNLKIGFYETIDIGSNGKSGQDGVEPRDALRTFYQRMDLSGDYTVQQDGAISIPLLGQFPVEGRTLDDIRTDLATAFTNVIGRSANIDVRILDRSPIYVVGVVKNPGAYKYTPGMIALQAIALAGGLDRGGESLPGVVEGAREIERLRIATLRVDELLARRARLEAQLEAQGDGTSALTSADGVSTSPTLDMRVSNLSRPVHVAKLDRESAGGIFLATEDTILRAEEAKSRQRSQEIALKVVTARNEVNALKHKLDQYDLQKDLRVERLEAMQKLKDRGVVTANNVLLLRTELADIESRRQDSLVAVVQAETRLAEAEGASAKLSSENAADLAKEIATVDEGIAAAREETISARTLATILYRPVGSPFQANIYKIVRQSKDGAKNLEATETSPLMPGDVLKVSSDNTAAIKPGSGAPEQQSWLAPPQTHTAKEN